MLYRERQRLVVLYILLSEDIGTTHGFNSVLQIRMGWESRERDGLPTKISGPLGVVMALSWADLLL